MRLYRHLKDKVIQHHTQSLVTGTFIGTDLGGNGENCVDRSQYGLYTGELSMQVLTSSNMDEATKAIASKYKIELLAKLASEKTKHDEERHEEYTQTALWLMQEFGKLYPLGVELVQIVFPRHQDSEMILDWPELLERRNISGQLSTLRKTFRVEWEYALVKHDTEIRHLAIRARAARMAEILLPKVDDISFQANQLEFRDLPIEIANRAEHHLRELDISGTAFAISFSYHNFYIAKTQRNDGLKKI